SECCSVAPLAAVFISPDEVMLFVVGFRKLLLLSWFFGAVADCSERGFTVSAIRGAGVTFMASFLR
ncbi:hypothetical protein, partial [Salmonella enterica]|uniref:hypothetical protein n=1 Tax=Salmonella enterica TaxID=28901 RepID=UPI001C12A8BF